MKSTWSCDDNPSETVESGTTIVLPYVWSHTDSGRTPSADIEIVTQTKLTLAQALEFVEEKALEYVRSNGAECLRHYFIEGVRKGNYIITFELGT